MKNRKTKLALTILLTCVTFVLLTFASQASSANGSPWLNDETGGTSGWYTPDDSEGVLPEGSVTQVNWWNGEDGAQPAADPWASGSLKITDETLFPDADFRAYLTAIDSDKNGGVSKEEAKSYFEKTGGMMDLWGSDCKVSDYTGVDCFGEYVTSLHCSSSVDSVKIDLSGLPQLDELYIRGCTLQTELDLSANPLLKKLDLWGTVLSSLDLSGNPALEILHVGDTGLDQLDLSANPALKTLYAFGNRLTALDLSANPAIGMIDVSYNRLTTLDLTATPRLYQLDCSLNPLQSLDLSAAPQLIRLDVVGCEITEIDVSACPNLKNIYLNGFSMTPHPLEDFTILEKFTEDGRIRYTSLQTILTDSLIVSRSPGEAGGDPAVSLVRPGADFELPECGFTAPEGKEFEGWQVGEDILQPGDRIPVDGNVTVTAVWKDLPAPPDPGPSGDDPTDPTDPTDVEPSGEEPEKPAPSDGAPHKLHGEYCVCYDVKGDGLFANIMRFLCAMMTLVRSLQTALGV